MCEVTKITSSYWTTLSARIIVYIFFRIPEIILNSYSWNVPKPASEGTCLMCLMDNPALLLTAAAADRSRSWLALTEIRMLDMLIPVSDAERPYIYNKLIAYKSTTKGDREIYVKFTRRCDLNLDKRAAVPTPELGRLFCKYRFQPAQRLISSQEIWVPLFFWSDYVKN